MKTISLVDKNDSGRSWSAKDALKDALKNVTDTEKILIIRLDLEDEKYDTKFTQAGLTYSECISLMEIQKTVFLSGMGFI